MKSVNVGTATNMQLNYMVALAEGFGPGQYMRDIAIRYNVKREASCLVVPINREYVAWHPCTSQAQAGAIIDREFISITIGNWDVDATPIVSSWSARRLEDEIAKNPTWAWAKTRLKAAMRCYVFSKLGLIVEIPDEL